MRIAFLGTPEFAVPSLRMLAENGYTLSVFTQPDRPVGRHGVPVAPPVKSFALSHDIPVYQYERVKSAEGLSGLCSFAPDLMVTAAFGQILSAENLDVPKLGCINVHGSLLPKYRGAAPIQWAVINGETKTGITTMFTDVGLDTGDILLSDEVSIDPDETAGELYARLAVVGAGTLKRTLDALICGTLKRTPQIESEATHCPMLKKEHGKLDFAQSAQAVHNCVRGTNPWPGAYAMLNDNPLKIWRTRLCPNSESHKTGYCFGSPKSGLFVSCGDGCIEVLEVQAPGGKRMDGKTFLRGNPITGQVLT